MRYGGDQGAYGAQRGYGADRYGSNEAGPSVSAPGGYGGLGRSPSQETMSTQAGKDALFGGARERYEQRQAETSLPPEEDPARGYGASGSGVPDMGYGTYQDRQLTVDQHTGPETYLRC